MRQRGTGRGRLFEWEPILLVDQNVFDGAVAIGAQPLRAVTRGLKPIGPMDAAEPHQPEARAIALLRMRTAFQEAGHEPAGRRAALFGPRDQAGGRPFGVRAMRLRHVLELRRKPTAARKARM